MSKKRCKLIIVVLVAFLVFAAVIGYITFVSSMVYEESSSHLDEIYTQSNKVFNGIVSEKWKSINDWLPYLKEAQSDEEASRYIRDRQEQWGFTDFYFISHDGDYMTSEGKTGYLSLGHQLINLITEDRNIVATAALPGSSELILFAVPAYEGTYRGFAFEAVGISYNNSDMEESLEISSFEESSRNYVIDGKGRVIIDCAGGERQVALNLISWLSREMKMRTQDINSLSAKINRKESGVTKFVK